ncbi:MAG: hypothetical protein KDJ35_01265 [Alphaproteobacteria bacterium]|nr:hypothetical protein [Alphaproteobacteria bacterium]
MGFTLKHRETDSRGSFNAWGVGFDYEYDAKSESLYIIRARDKKPLLYINCEERLTLNPLQYTTALEKATQINAMVFSGNTNVDLSEILQGRQLRTMIKTAALQASYCFDLQQEDFDLFEQRFCETYLLRKLRLNKCVNADRSSAFFRGELQTKTQNSIESSGAKLYSVINSLSTKAMYDLLYNTYGQPSQEEAQNLIDISSNLALIGKILDKNFHPMHKIAHIQALERRKAS